MGYIYKITNMINQHSYIGKTDQADPYQRWKRHQSAAKLDTRCQHFPLYLALNKYGIQNFSFDIIEETQDTTLREIYWIDFYNTYKEGYNATLGGEGCPIINVEEIINLYSQGYNCKQIAIQTHHDAGWIAGILHQHNIIVKPSKDYCSKQVSQYSKEGTFIQDFVSLSAAARWCTENGKAKHALAGEIGNVCKNKPKRKTAYGYIWRYKGNI